MLRRPMSWRPKPTPPGGCWTTCSLVSMRRCIPIASGPSSAASSATRRALALGLRVGSIYGRATGDRTYARRFRARKLRLDGTVLLGDRRYRAALQPLTTALTEAEALGDRWLNAITRVNLAYGRLELGHGAAALAESERAAEVARSLDVKARALTLPFLASVHLHLQNYRRSIEYSRQAVEVSQAAANRLWEGNSLLNIGAAYQQLGENDASRAAYEAALKVLETTKDRIGAGRALCRHGGDRRR